MKALVVGRLFDLQRKHSPPKCGGELHVAGLTNWSELGAVQARQNELLGLVQLYEALGGRWQQ